MGKIKLFDKLCKVNMFSLVTVLSNKGTYVALLCNFSVVDSLDKPSVDKSFTPIHQDEGKVSNTWPDTRGTVSQTPRTHKRTIPIGPTETLSAGKVRGKQEAAVGEPLVLISF